MISLPGLLLGTLRAREAAEVLRTFARFATGGLIPNRFPDGKRVRVPFLLTLRLS